MTRISFCTITRNLCNPSWENVKSLTRPEEIKQRKELARLFAESRLDVTEEKYRSFTISPQIFGQVFSDHLSSLWANGRDITFYNLPSTLAMTSEQRAAVMEVLSRKQPHILGRFGDFYVRSEQDLQVWAEVLSKNSPETFLDYHGRPMHGSKESQKNIDKLVHESALRVLKKDPKKWTQYQYTDLGLDQKERDELFKEISKKVPYREIATHAEFYKPSRNGWIEAFPQEVLCDPYRKFSNEEKFLAFRNLIKENPQNIVTHHNKFCSNTFTLEQRKELLSLALKKDPKISERLKWAFSQLSESEARDLQSLKEADDRR